MRKKLIKQLPLLIEISQLIQAPTSYDNLKKDFVKALGRNRPMRKSFLKGTGGIPLMKKTADAVSCAHRLNVSSTWTKSMSDWVRECECEGGGYSPAPGFQADLLHSACGLRMVSEIGGELRWPAHVHEEWLRSQMSDLIESIMNLDESQWLESLRLILSALTDLNGSPNVNEYVQKRIREESLQRWRRSSKKTRDARNLCEIMDSINDGDDRTLRDIREDWLPSRERTLNSLKPNSMLSTIVDLIWIVKSCYPRQYQKRESIRQASDNVFKAYKFYTESPSIDA